jgi:hypothetical protein
MKAAAAGPGLPLAPPSEKTINRLYMFIPSLLCSFWGYLRVRAWFLRFLLL